MIDEVKSEATKAGIGVVGATLTAITLNQWVAIATLIYLALQSAYLIWKWIKEAGDK